MRIVRFDEGRVGLLEGGEVCDVSEAFPGHGESWPEVHFIRAIGRWEETLPRLESARSSGARKPLEDCRLLPPVLNPSKIVAAPVNYIAHREEMLVDYTVENAGFFLKSPTSIVGPEDAIRLPFSDRRQDPEVELAAIIGRKAYKVRTEDALAHVFAYTIAIDVTVRGKEDRPYRKSFDTFTPIGPCLLTPDELGDPQNLQLRLSVNGELRQDAHTSDMVCGVAELIERASWAFPLLPGDVLMTGTPEGVSRIYPGDRIEVEIDKIGGFSMPVEEAG